MRKSGKTPAGGKGAILEAAMICGFCGAGFGLAALLAGGRARPGLATFFLGAALGAYIGLAALPYFSPQNHKPRPSACATLAAIFGALLAIAYAMSAGVAALTILLAALIGYLAPRWAPHA